MLDAAGISSVLGIVHQDLKPANILVSNLGNSSMKVSFSSSTPVAAIADLGLAKSLSETITLGALGTLQYLQKNMQI